MLAAGGRAEEEERQALLEKLLKDVHVVLDKAGVFSESRLRASLSGVAARRC